MAELGRRFGDAIDVALIKGERGVFDVVADGRRIFSKHERGRFPGGDEIVAAIERLQGAAS